MANGITTQQLQAVIGCINVKLGTPLEPYTKLEGKGLVSNAGNYHLDNSYGKVELRQMSKGGMGGSSNVFGGLCTKPELYRLMHAFLSGIDAARGQ
jgi:hypothetical protein